MLFRPRLKTSLKGLWLLFKRVASLYFLMIGLKSTTFAQLQGAPPSSPTPATEKVIKGTNFEWDIISGAKSYEVEILQTDKPGAQASFFKVTEPTWNGILTPGKYTMRLRSRDRRGVPGDWSPKESFEVKLYAPTVLAPLPGSQIKSNDSTSQELIFKWEFQNDASKYKLHLEDDSKSFSQDYEVTGTELKIKLPVARNYSWNLIGFDKQGNPGQVLPSAMPFTILGKKLETPKITYPETIFVRDLNWDSVPLADSYTYSLQKRAPNRKWQDFKTETVTNNQIVFDGKWSGGDYKLNVSATGKLRLNSNTHSIVFKVTNGERTAAAEQRALMRKSLDRTVDWYFIASYLITQMDYNADNLDSSSKISSQVIGGTGRLGLGYLNAKNPLGFLGIVDLSGFYFGEKNYTFPSLEAHGVFRWAPGFRSEVRLSGGGYYKELPEIRKGTSDTNYTVSQIGFIGAHAGGEYWYSLNQKLGVQFNGRVYYPFAAKTTNNLGIISTPSLQFGFMGSLRLNPRATGLMGYAYRKDAVTYPTTNASAIAAGYKNNTSTITGHYLNFFLELDF